VGFLKFVGPSIRKSLGCQSLDPRVEIQAKISKDVPVTKLGYLYYLRTRLERDGNVIIAKPGRLKGSGIISSLTETDGIIEISPNEEGIKKGDNVVVKLYPQ
jgi:molybdopterin molybdotransferase